MTKKPRSTRRALRRGTPLAGRRSPCGGTFRAPVARPPAVHPHRGRGEEAGSRGAAHRVPCPHGVSGSGRHCGAPVVATPAWRLQLPPWPSAQRAEGRLRAARDISGHPPRPPPASCQASPSSSSWVWAGSHRWPELVKDEGGGTRGHCTSCPDGETEAQREGGTLPMAAQPVGALPPVCSVPSCAPREDRSRQGRGGF